MDESIINENISEVKPNHQEHIHDIIFNKDEITWQNVIYDLVKNNNMDPWDIDIGVLAKKFIEKLKEYKEMDFRISGKVVLAAVILLKLKSHKLVTDDIGNLDRLIASTEEQVDEFGEEILNGESLDDGTKEKPEIPALNPRTPQPRTRKVSIFDLVEALEKALDVKDRRLTKHFAIMEDYKIEAKSFKDLSEVIKEVYSKLLVGFKSGRTKITFSELLRSDSKEDKVLTFLPLLHLTNQRKIDMEQTAPFSEIEVVLKGVKQK